MYNDVFIYGNPTDENKPKKRDYEKEQEATKVWLCVYICMYM